MTRSKLPTGFREMAKAMPLLCGCSDRELEAVARDTTLLLVDPGTVICREGSPGPRSVPHHQRRS